jgi:hypothetical protein
VAHVWIVRHGKAQISTPTHGVTTQYLVEDDVNPTGLPQVFDEVVNGAVTRTYTYGLQSIRLLQS